MDLHKLLRAYVLHAVNVLLNFPISDNDMEQNFFTEEETEAQLASAVKIKLYGQYLEQKELYLSDILNETRLEIIRGIKKHELTHEVSPEHLEILRILHEPRLLLKINWLIEFLHDKGQLSDTCKTTLVALSPNYKEVLMYLETKNS